MKLTIHKYPIPLVPGDHEIVGPILRWLHVGTQPVSEIHLKEHATTTVLFGWAEVDLDQPDLQAVHILKVRWTGYPLDGTEGMFGGEHLASVQVDGLMVHVYVA